MTNKSYVPILVNLLTDDMIAESVGSETSYAKSLDGSIAILGFKTLHPNSMAGYDKLNHSQILQYLADNSADWDGEV